MSENHLMPDEPLRFTKDELDKLLVYCSKLGASDVTLQTGEPAIAEVHGKLLKITKRSLFNAEVGEVLNSIYGPNGTTQILSGHDVDTHYEIPDLCALRRILA